MKVELAGHKRVFKDSLPEYWRRRIITDLTYENPKYTALVRHRPHLLSYYKRAQQWDKIPDEELKFYSEDTTSFFVPRGYPVGEEGQEEVSDLRCRKSADWPAVEPDRELRKEQSEAMAAWKGKREPSGIFVLPTGAGKTLLGIEIGRVLKQKTLVLVDRKETGFDEWVKDCRYWLGCDPGMIAGSKHRLNSFCVIAMMQTLWSRKDLMHSLWDTFGCVIVDECQSTPASTYMEIVSNFAARYRYGVTATPRRTDGLDKVIFWAFGPKIFERVLAEKVLPVRVKTIRTGFIVPDEYEDAHGNKKRRDRTYLNRYMMQMADRNRLLARKIVELGEPHTNLCGTHRTWHAVEMANLLAKIVGPENVGIMAASVGKKEKMIKRQVKPDEGVRYKPAEVKALAKEGSLKYVVGTYAFMYRGLDVPVFDAGHMLSPLSNEIWLKQFVGRTRRAYGDQERAWLFDYVDANGIPFRSYQKRKRWYRQWAEEGAKEKQKQKQGDLEL